MLAMLIVPFMTPLLDDALRSVPADLKRGSLALGATRWYTLRRIVFPAAMPGIVSAVTLGTLVAVGEVVIPSFVLGGAENLATMPLPLWDVFRRTPALTSWSASQMGGLGGEAEGTQSLAVSVSFAAGLLLLALAAAIMGLEQLLLRRLRGARP
jgi:phosphate transport system permease protein